MGRTLFTKQAISRRVGELATEIARDCGREKDLAVVGILNGSFMFAADLVRGLYSHGTRVVLDFMVLSSYGSGTKSSGKVKVEKDAAMSVKGKRVLLVDDILDTGLTLAKAKAHLLSKGAAEVKLCVLLDKPSRRKSRIRADYAGFRMKDVFVIGYGLDFDSRYRELPFIAELAREKKPRRPRNSP